MIPRYSRPEMTAIWSPETKFRIWFEIEAHAASAMAELGIIPKEAAKKIWDKGNAATFDVARIDAIEAEVKHDVIAFLTHLAEIVGPEARFVHPGMTSSDVLDTCLNVQLVRAADILIADVDALLAALKRRAFEYKMTPTIGRSHGIHAEPTTFGLKLAVAYAEFARAKERLIAARKEVATCAISGAVGTFAQIDPRVEAYVAKAMGLAVEPVSTQVIPRDRHAMYFATLGVIASSMERLATEIRHLQRTEVLEAEEFFSAGQKGSSAMPHKRNPVLSENVTGLARMVRAYALPAMENVVLWHERDISHSSVERMIGPDATVTLDFALARMAGIIDKLIVYPDNMKKNLDRLGGLVHSQRVLIALTQKGVAREDAYALVQRNAMKVWNGESSDFLGAAQGRQGGARGAHRQGARGQFRPRLSLQARRHDLQTGVRRGMSVPATGADYSLRPVFIGWIAFLVQLPFQLFFTVWSGGFFGGFATTLIGLHGRWPFIFFGALGFVAVPLVAFVGKKLNYARTEYNFFPDRLELEEGFFIDQPQGDQVPRRQGDHAAQGTVPAHLRPRHRLYRDAGDRLIAHLQPLRRARLRQCVGERRQRPRHPQSGRSLRPHQEAL